MAGQNFKHGIAGYSNHKCRCGVCRSANKAKREDEKKRLFGKEPPRHGTGGGYVVYGCRCEACSDWRRKSHKKYRDALRGKIPPRHGLTGHDAYGCRCEVCTNAKRKSHEKRKNNPVVRIKEKERGWARNGIVGFTYEDFCRKYDEQNGRCAICGKEMKKASEHKSEVATVDHDHSTGKARALLCGNCNKMIGSSEPSVLRMGADYLELHANGGGI